ncbi:hypothetical protein BDV29DRAFT_173675 [Aspergillus leporis]|uniref:Uncharacterized protein n=1 Tax=Aspergillus leporis TaxID=41062 RepID=A0A5N5X0T2_9EURO|nr:hypothetical protein BDV29DRAFT_173675 [Aspergillus leporis]
MNTDPFGRLPWFVLQRILSNLPSLPALHNLYTASPEVVVFLHQNNDLFAQIVDAIIGNPVRERGLAPHVQNIMQLIILVWTRQRTAGPMQEPDKDILGSLHYIRECHREYSLMLNITSPLTPSAFLYQLVHLMARLRCLIHACFHSMIARCLQLQLEHLPKKARYHTTRPVVDRSRRPQGIPYTPVDIGPPTWAEEQRLLSSFLCVVLFYELRKAHVEHSLIMKDSECARALLDNNVEGFWEKILWGCNNEGQEEQIATLLHWLDQQVDGRGNIYPWLLSGKVLEDYSHCCQCYTTVIDAQMHETEIMENDLNEGRSSRGMLCLWTCKRDLRSPLKGVDNLIFRPYGLVFWDGVRMDSLGFPGRRAPHRMWFAWSSIFTEEDWKELLRKQSTITVAA